MKTLPSLLCVVASLGAVCAAFAAPIASFSADLVDTRPHSTRTSSFHFQGPAYCYETSDKNRSLSISVDPAAGVTRVIEPIEKAYLELKSDDRRAVLMNPFAACVFPFDGSELRTEGKETVNGMRCTRKVLRVGGADTYTAWIADELNFPIRVEDRLQQRTLELTNIERRPLDPDIFGVPAGYRRIEDDAEPGSARVARVAAASTSAAQPSAAPSAQAPEATHRLILILDISGSMSEQIEGRAKVDMAKEAFSKLVDRLPADLEVGLMAYGHRRVNDCEDIELLLPVAKVDKAALKNKVAGLTPRGLTPLGAAVKKAAGILDHAHRRATVVLVSDGLETCNSDPCALAAELARTGADFKLHVIGFGLEQRDQERLRCLADATGGLFLAAADVATLLDAMTQSVSAVQEPPKPVVEDPGTATLSGPASIPTGAAFEVRWEGPDSKNDTVALATKGPPAQTLAYAFTSRGNPAALIAAADPGDYELHYVHGHTGKVIGHAEIKVTAVAASVEAPPAVDAAAEFSVAWKGPAYKSDLITLARPDQPEALYLSYVYAHDANPVKLRAPGAPGEYEVRYVLGRGGKKLASRPLTVREVGAKIEFPEQAEVGQALAVTWQGPGNPDDMITVCRLDQPAGAYLNYASLRSGNPAKVWAPSEAGDYEVRYVLGQGNQVLAKKVLHVGAATASLEFAPRAAAATWIEVRWKGPSAEGDYICVSRPDQAPGAYLHYVRVKDNNPLRIRAPGAPGTYELRYVLERGRKLLARSPLAVEDVTASVEPPTTVTAGKDFEVRFQGPAYSDDMLTVARTDQAPAAYLNYTRVRAGAAAKLKAPKEPGTYEVRYVLGFGGRALAKVPFTVTAP